MASWSFITEKDNSIHLTVAVKPGSRKKAIIIDENDNFLFIHLQSPPDKGKANKELLKYLSNFFDIQLAFLQIISGHTSRTKVVTIEHSTKEEIIKKLLEKKNES